MGIDEGSMAILDEVVRQLRKRSMQIVETVFAQARCLSDCKAGVEIAVGGSVGGRVGNWRTVEGQPK